eukprot:356039-Chlamydomonas_euryale.AAC.1
MAGPLSVPKAYKFRPRPVCTLLHSRSAELLGSCLLGTCQHHPAHLATAPCRSAALAASSRCIAAFGSCHLLSFGHVGSCPAEPYCIASEPPLAHTHGYIRPTPQRSPPSFAVALLTRGSKVCFSVTTPSPLKSQDTLLSNTRCPLSHPAVSPPHSANCPPSGGRPTPS